MRSAITRHQLQHWQWLMAAWVMTVGLLFCAALFFTRQPRRTAKRVSAPSGLQLSANQLFAQRHQSAVVTPEIAAEELTTKTIDVSDLVTALQEQLGESEDTTREFLVHLLRFFIHTPQQVEEYRESSSRQPSITLSGDKLVARLGKSGHESVAQQLEILREHGFAELAVEVRVLTGPAAVLDAASVNWRLIGGGDPPAPPDEKAHMMHQTGSTDDRISCNAESVVEKQLPAILALLDEAQVRQLAIAAQDHPTTNIAFAPKVTVFNGQSAQIQDGTQRPFIVGVKPTAGGGYQPQIRVVTEGTTIRVRPELYKNKRVHLDVGVRLSSVKESGIADFPLGAGKQPISVQVPDVTTVRIQSTVEMELDQHLAIGIPAIKKDPSRQPACVIVSVRNIDGPFITPTSATPPQMQ